ncbi:hypothetical protein [Methanoculleus sp.]|uniref:hypothetical protein n=1 Tax=Methanoculleus sp. TaxID=90427 RepID=UPI002FC78A5A
MRGRPILLLILIIATVVAGGCTAPEDAATIQPVSPSPAPTEVQAVGAGQPAPTPAVPAGAEKTPKSVGFVDPGTYRLPTPTPTITMTKQPNDLQVSGRMVEYAKATIDYPPGVLATEVYHIPFPYWAINMSATPIGDSAWLEMEICDPVDPNRAIKEIRFTRGDFLLSANVSSENGSVKVERSYDIREGYNDYYFVICSGSLKSLTITIQVPEKYLV